MFVVYYHVATGEKDTRQFVSTSGDCVWRSVPDIPHANNGGIISFECPGDEGGDDDDNIAYQRISVSLCNVMLLT